MYLKTLTLDNFRSFDHLEIPLCKNLTILVGENNGGKSNAIDSIRLLTKPLGGRRDVYCETTDIRFGSDERKFEIIGRFDELSAPQQGRLISATADDTVSACVFGLTYDESAGRYPVRPSLWGGERRATPEPGCQEMIRHVYLPPLRDAKRALASGNPTRIYALLNHFLDGRDPEDLAAALGRSNDDDTLTTVQRAVDVGLTALTSGVRRQSAALGFASDEKLIDIARDLRFKLADHGIEPEDLRYSGHGYANLLYMATVAVELEKVDTSDLTLFLVEEPAAHLHPQLQAAVLSFLQERAEQSRRPTTGLGPCGELQVVVATHSPNLSAWVPSRNLVSLRSLVPKRQVGITATEPPDVVSGNEGDSATTAAALTTAPRRVTRCIPLAQLALDPIERRKIDRYLDVTKSALLFGGRVLMVEGVAEALLLPVIAKKFVLNTDVEKRRVFRSAVFVPIDGVDFEPYVKLMLTPFNGVRIADRLIVLTDGDGERVGAEEESPGRRRKRTLEELVTRLGARESFKVIINTYSLETALVRAGNRDLMKQLYLKVHPQSGDRWDSAANLVDRAQATAIQQLFRTTRKGDFAQLLAEAITSGRDFTVPPYLKCAIEALVA